LSIALNRNTRISLLICAILIVIYGTWDQEEKMSAKIWKASVGYSNTNNLSAPVDIVRCN
jgi:hypothetical protein